MVGFSEYCLRLQYPFFIKCALLGPVAIGFGLGRLIAGNNTILNIAVTTPLFFAGIVISLTYEYALENGKPNFGYNAVQTSVRAVTDVVGITQPRVSRAKLDAALAEMRTKADDLNKRKASVNMNDKAAVDALQKEILAFNARQVEVTAMYNAYMLEENGTNALADQLTAGSWTFTKTRGKRTIVTIIRHYKANGDVHEHLSKEYNPDIPASMGDPGENAPDENGDSTDFDGRWALHGTTLSTCFNGVGDVSEIDKLENETMKLQELDEHALTELSGTSTRVWTHGK